MEYDNNPKISVIVPIYNVEKYIARCLDSIEAQTFADFEVVMVNDGTKDNSAQIAETYATRDPRFRLINRENGGVGEARNTGLANANGEYIVFVDGDDAVTPLHLAKLYEIASACDADIACCSYACRNENTGKIRASKIAKKEGVYRGEKIKRCVIRDLSVRCYLWSKMWRKSLFTLHDITFPNRYFEDSTLIPKLFYYANTIAVTKEPSYIYTIRNNSITGLTSKRCVGDYLAANKEVMDFYNSQYDHRDYKVSLAFLKFKAGLVAFCWIFVRIWRAKTFDYAGHNFALVWRHYLPKKMRQKIEKKQLEAEKI